MFSCNREWCEWCGNLLVYGGRVRIKCPTSKKSGKNIKNDKNEIIKIVVSLK